MFARPHIPAPLGMLPNLGGGDVVPAGLGAYALDDWTARSTRMRPALSWIGVPLIMVCLVGGPGSTSAACCAKGTCPRTPPSPLSTPWPSSGPLRPAGPTRWSARHCRPRPRRPPNWASPDSTWSRPPRTTAPPAGSSRTASPGRSCPTWGPRRLRRLPPRRPSLTQPLQIVVGGVPGEFGSYRDGFDLFRRACSRQKDIFVVPGESHYDLCWKPEATERALDTLIPFYDKNL